MMIGTFCYYTIVKGMKLVHKTGFYKEPKIFIRIFLLFPLRFWADLFNRQPYEFTHYGCHMVAGEQGSGKTITVVHLLRKMKKKFPEMKIATNFAYNKEDYSIEHWEDLVFRSNGIYGQIDVIDEIQNWFSSMQSKNFPEAMLQEISQQRKQRKMILCTAQRFERVAKPIREQVNFLYKPFTIAGAMTIVHVVKPMISADGEVGKDRHVKWYMFVHDDEIRNSFDTYKKIERLSKSGFIEKKVEL